MLQNSQVFSSFAAPDIAQVKRFYAETLGLAVEDGEMGEIRIALARGAQAMIYPKPDHTPATYTVLNFPVDDIDAAVDDLGARGVEFERYEGFGQDEKGIARGDEGPPIAWFTDPAGNICSVFQG